MKRTIKNVLGLAALLCTTLLFWIPCLFLFPLYGVVMRFAQIFGSTRASELFDKLIMAPLEAWAKEMGEFESKYCKWRGKNDLL